MRRLTILLATVAALLLVPAAQAFANGTLTINIEGSGGGEVASYTEFGFGITTPLLACSYESPGPASGVCEAEMEYFEEAEEDALITATAAPGSEFVGFAFEEGEEFFCNSGSGTEIEPGVFLCGAAAAHNANAKATAFFEKEGGEGPTNKRTLTVTKSAGGSGGVGTVSSKPKGIKCATGCNKAVGSFYKESNVALTAKPATGSTFVEWTGACTGAGACTVAMSEDKEVGAVFGGTSKAILSPTALTLTKGESTGFGTVKATGLACEAECTETTVLYQGTITEPKPKAAKTVELSQAPAFGSEFSGWSGCDSEAEGKCIVTMSEAKEVTATYTAKPNVALTLNKNAYATGTGTVSSKPKGIKCATTCTTQTMAVPQGESVVLKQKPASGMTFVEWEGGGCTGSSAETCTVSMSEAKTVTAKFSGTPKAIANPQTLTLTKAGSAFGTVKASGLACEALCTSASSLYAGTVTEPKPKAAATVTLEAFPAPGSQAVVWSGCDSETEGKCVVSMTEGKAVTATFDELE